MIFQETGKNVSGIESDGGCDVEEFDHVDPALAGFVFRDIGLGFAEPLRQRGLGQAFAAPCCDQQ